MTVSEILSGLPQKDQTRLPVIFNGREPRLLGWADTIYAADRLAVLNHVSATFCSLAEFAGRRFFVLHG